MSNTNWWTWAAAATAVGAFAFGAVPVGVVAGLAAAGLYIRDRQKQAMDDALALPGEVVEQVYEEAVQAGQAAYETSATALRAAIPAAAFDAMRAAKNYAEGDSMYAVAEGRGGFSLVGPRKGNVILELQQQLRGVSSALNRPDLDPGRPDGTLGPKTVRAVQAFQDLAGKTEPEVRSERYSLRVGPATATALGFRGTPWA